MAAPPSRPPRLLWRAVALTLLAVVLVGVVIVVTRTAEPEGLVVHVQVVDPEGRPVAGAEVQRRFAPGWELADDAGRVRLVRVVLREGEAPSPESIDLAVEARGPDHATRSWAPPTVERRADDTWSLRATVWPRGLLRLRVRPTHLPAPRAWLVARPRHAVEAVDGVEVARPGQPASWRVFRDVESLEVRVEGASGMAARARRVPPPGSGFVREVEVVAEKSRPVRGRLLPPPGEAPPTLAGRVQVTELADDGEEVRHHDVALQPDGAFEVPYAGEGRYRLVFQSPFLDVGDVEARGGDVLTVDEAVLRPWLDVRSTADLLDPATDVRAHAVDGGAPLRASVREANRVCVPVPGPGRWRVEVERPGTERGPPAFGTAEVEVRTSGPHAVHVDVGPRPASDVEVRVEAPPEGGGAIARLVEPGRARPATVLFELGHTAHFGNVRAGPVRVEVEWGTAGLAKAFLAGTASGDATLELTARPLRGGALVVERAGVSPFFDAAPRVVTWPAEGNPYGAPGSIVLARRPRTRGWHATHGLVPGAYRARIHRHDEPSANGEEVEFEIRAGEATTIRVDLEEER